MESLSPKLQNLVAQVASKNNITNYTVEVSEKTVSKDGDGYIGILSGLTVIDEDSDKKLNLVVKKAPTNENLRKQFPTQTCFLREIRLYEEILPELFKLQEEYDVPNPFKSVTKLHGFISDELEETLLLENVKEQGFTLCNRQEPLDSHHLSLVITEYAKLHALSHALKKLKPDKFEEIKKEIGENVMVEFQNNQRKKQSKDDPPIPDFSNPNDRPGEMEFFFSPTMEAVKSKPHLLKAMNEFKKSCFQLMFKDSQATDEYEVVSHGDCWSTNLLFKYEDEDIPTVPTKLCIIDWQMSLITTPIHDISYFLYISAGKKDLQNFRRYLLIYHTALSENLTAFGLDPDDVYSLETFEREWKEKSRLGFFMTLVMMQQTLSEGKTHDFEERAKEGKSIFDSSDLVNNVSDLFIQRMGDLVEFLVEQDFI